MGNSTYSSSAHVSRVVNSWSVCGKEEERLKPKAALAAIDALEKSKGWIYITHVMRGEILMSAERMGEKRKMEIDEIHFQRGAIWAAQQLLRMPERLRLRIENEVALGSAKAELKETEHG